MHRRYSSGSTRFEQPDPYNGSYNLTNPQSFNRYSYVHNDPVNFVDPSGLDVDELGPPPPPPTQIDRIITNEANRLKDWGQALFGSSQYQSERLGNIAGKAVGDQLWTYFGGKMS